MWSYSEVERVGNVHFYFSLQGLEDEHEVNKPNPPIYINVGFVDPNIEQEHDEQEYDLSSNDLIDDDTSNDDTSEDDISGYMCGDYMSGDDTREQSDVEFDETQLTLVGPSLEVNEPNVGGGGLINMLGGSETNNSGPSEPPLSELFKTVKKLKKTKTKVGPLENRSKKTVTNKKRKSRGCGNTIRVWDESLFEMVETEGVERVEIEGVERVEVEPQKDIGVEELDEVEDWTRWAELHPDSLDAEEGHMYKNMKKYHRGTHLEKLVWGDAKVWKQTEKEFLDQLKLDDPAGYDCEYHTIAKYVITYNLIIHVIDDPSEWGQPGFTVLPLPLVRGPGRPKKQKIKDQDEVLGNCRSCGKCGALGHMKKTCKGPSAQPSGTSTRQRNRLDTNSSTTEHRRNGGRGRENSNNEPENSTNTRMGNGKNMGRATATRGRGTAAKTGNNAIASTGRGTTSNNGRAPI
ncbi:hypothetical protein GIB67_031074 [Kingdonia uniflora]|uniref:CCHC-type domain-containing protein n=1 Tax=Kingdonia uniflora TaxID=39325 RepID=A0A7J7LCK6_9MAGN|nr:hypothetical protein GIB67_031074 [Kingdonia uniflora]